jgi:Kef-type K+ transport system membrane component KefB
VLARILTEHRLLATDVGKVAIACAAFDDVAGWLILAGILTFARVGASRVWLVQLVLFGGYLVTMTTAI